jgi:uncharacterized protein YndB with AHSA1/START domain
MTTLYHQIWINAPAAKVYEAISTENGIGNWWDKPRTLRSDAATILEFNPGPEHGVLKARVIEIVRERRVEWEFVSTHPKSSPASAWTGTHVSFEVSRRPLPPWAVDKVDTTVLDFRHSGWDERSEYVGFCNFAWGEALQKLRQWCESGQGSSTVDAARGAGT